MYILLRLRGALISVGVLACLLVVVGVSEARIGVLLSEPDGSPADTYVYKMVMPDGTIVISNGVATYTAAAGTWGGTLTSSTPKITLDDSDGANGFWAVNATDASDAVATFGVDDSNGTDQTYIELDGVNERIEFKYAVQAEETFSLVNSTTNFVLDDTDGADGSIQLTANDASDATLSFHVDDSNGDDQSYLEIDGVNERLESKYPHLFEGDITLSLADPDIVLDDSDGADGFIQLAAIDAADAVMTLGVDDSNGDDQTYVELDGSYERLEFKYSALLEVGGDFNDADITSVDKLEGVDAQVYIDLGADGTVEVESDNTITLDASETHLRVDAAAYLKIATADGGATTISQESDGTDQITIGDGGDRVDVASDSWDMTDGTLTGVTLDADNSTLSNIVIGTECTGASTNLTDTADLLYEAELDALSELVTQMADVTAFITDDDMPAAGADPDVDAAGEIGRDTDDNSLRGYDDSDAVQFVYGQKLKTISLRIADPENSHIWAGRVNPSFPFWFNNSGFSFIITEIHAISDTDNYDFNIFESASNVDMSDDNDVLVDLVECVTDGTECFTDTETSITAATIETDHALIWEHSDGAAGDLLIVITGYLDGDVN